jgi:hypothetical protein
MLLPNLLYRGLLQQFTTILEVQQKQCWQFLQYLMQLFIKRKLKKHFNEIVNKKIRKV